MIGNSSLIVLLEDKLYFFLIHKVIDKPCRKGDVAADIAVVDVEHRRVLVAQVERAARTRGQHCATVGARSLADAGGVNGRLALRLLVKAIGDEGDTAALLLLEQVYAITDGIHHLNQVLTQFWEVVIHIAAVEIAHVVGVSVLLLSGMALEPSSELLAAIGGECAVLVDGHHAVHHHFSGF